MADCELCGAMKVGTRNVMMGRAQVQACTRCIEKLGLEQKKVAPGLAAAKGTNATSGGYGGIGKKGKDIMLRGEKELANDFGERFIHLARNTYIQNDNRASIKRKINERCRIYELSRCSTICNEII